MDVNYAIKMVNEGEIDHLIEELRNSELESHKIEDIYITLILENVRYNNGFQFNIGSKLDYIYEIISRHEVKKFIRTYLLDRMNCELNKFNILQDFYGKDYYYEVIIRLNSNGRLNRNKFIYDGLMETMSMFDENNINDAYYYNKLSTIIRCASHLNCVFEDYLTCK